MVVTQTAINHMAGYTPPDALNPIWQPFPQPKPTPEEPVEEQEAEIRWGGPSSFTLTPTPLPRYSFEVGKSECNKWTNSSFDDCPDEEEEEEGKQCKDYPDILRKVECDRKTSTIEIAHPDDANFVVSVTRIDEIWWTGQESLQNPTEVVYHDVLKHPAQGQTP